MSSANVSFAALMLAIVAGTGACASQPKPTPEEAQLAKAKEAAMRPASAEEIAAANRADPLTKANFWSREFAKDPESLSVALGFASALRELGSHQRVIEVASQALIVHPGNADLLMLLGRSFASSNDPRGAAQAFGQAAQADPGRADAWTALGTVHDQSGSHATAQAAYQKALAIDPDRTSTLANYGLSLALSGDLAGGEAQLRKAAANPDADVRVRENLALVLGLQGRFDEMKAASAPGAPADIVEENAALLKAMIQPARSWEALTAAAEPGRLPPPPKPADQPAADPARDAAPVAEVPDAPESKLTLRR